MNLTSITLENYRNYEKLALTFSHKLNIFLGENAQGKTNLLESIYVLAMARSHRTANEKELIRWHEPYAKIKGEVSKKNGTQLLEMVISNKGKKTKLNDLEQSKLSHYIGAVNVILFSPEDLSLVKGAPQNRRKFLDMEIGQISPLYLHHLSSYQTVLKQRNHYLKKMPLKQKKDQTYLDILSEQLSEYGSHVLFHRLSFLRKLERWANEIHQRISYRKEILTISYKCSADIEQSASLEKIQESLLKSLKENEQRDLMRQTTSVGPHRDDLIFNVNDLNIQTYGSQGQQRTTALSIKLAEIELINEEIGEYPILLLDDVLSELDDERQVHLLEFIESKLQTFLTTTNIFHLKEKLTIEPEVFWINDGKVERKRD